MESSVSELHKFLVSSDASKDIESFREKFKNQENVSDSSIRLIHEPFSCCQVKNFIQEDAPLQELKKKLEKLKMCEKNNDLYQFHQSQDLKNIKSDIIKQFYEFLRDDVLKWVRDATGFPLADTIDATCSRYDHTDVLLCHDDELEGRRVAFIFYLVPPDWKESDGGALDLFSTQPDGRPGDVVESIIPLWNSFAFFEVTPKSYHQVAEVLSKDKSRLSVNGWFHGPSVPRSALPPRPPPCLTSWKEDAQDELMWRVVSPQYMAPATMADVQEQLEEESEVQLEAFLQPDMFSAVLEALRELPEEAWQLVGPPNRRRYHRLESPPTEGAVSQVLETLQSEHFFLLLSNLTGLRLHPLAPQDSEDEEKEEEKEGEPPAAKKARVESPEAQGSSGDILSAAGDNGALTSSANDSQAVSSKDVAGPSSSSKEEVCSSRCGLEVRKWVPGSYTLLSDTDAALATHALDVSLSFGADDWPVSSGGVTSYIAKGEDEELLSIEPRDNCLALVYRDPETLRFTKYINCSAPSQGFFEIAAVYYE